MTDVKVSDELADWLEELVADLGLDPDEALRWSYSGRAMYGETCLGLVCDTSELVRFTLSLGKADDPDDDLRLELGTLVDAMRRGTRYDSMGHSTIYYWPRVGRQS
jgi:hypothetical protein